MTAIGERRHSFTVQRDESTSQTASGGLAEDWQTFASNLKGSYSDLSGRELRVAGQFQHGITGIVKTRYYAGVTAGMRLLLGSRVLYIRAVVNPNMQNRWLHLFVEERPST